ncbi:hypothetical protein QFC22_003823 [Naganishia vaughanmartiniae]|uniref:Uncharacterized protein n=1 Tax=Naganishia vaughanmartiniae TaxID=1424756 RepID=A0ACC2X494_9TREE|nr:hypothetical protein QFC22_003823 [Naganishia vaughanmartiniae]
MVPSTASTNCATDAQSYRCSKTEENAKENHEDSSVHGRAAGLAVAAQAKANADAEKIRELVNLVRERDEQAAESQREANQSRTMAEEASDGRRNTESWRKMLKEDAELMRPTDRPLVGNSVVRIWRDSRLPHTLSKSQSDIWDIRPEASSDSTSRLASATVSRNQGEVGGVDGVRVITPVIERGNGTSGTESGGEPQSDNGSGEDSEEESQDEGSISQSGAMDEGDEEDST